MTQSTKATDSQRFHNRRMESGLRWYLHRQHERSGFWFVVDEDTYPNQFTVHGSKRTIDLANAFVAGWQDCDNFTINDRGANETKAVR